MKFRYNGGDCSGSFNIQPDTLFQCFDYNGGPPREDGALSWIEAFELGGGEVYFDGLATVGETITLLAEIKFAANMNFTIYNPGTSTDGTTIKTAANIVQTVIYHSSCSSNLFLKDRFGSVQLVEFTNYLQGVVSCFANATLTLAIGAPITVSGTDATLTQLTVIGNAGVFDFTDQVAGMVVGPNSPFTFVQQIKLDLTVRQKYSFLSTIAAVTDDGTACFGTDFIEFTAGNPLPPIFPTLAPSPAPTITASPTPDILTAACELEADINCRLTEGTRCDIVAPTSTSCIGSPATELLFVYDPTVTCATDNNTASGFDCTDLSTALPDEVFVKFLIRKNEKEKIHAQGTFSKGEVITVQLPLVEFTTFEVWSVGSNGTAGVMLQQSLNLDVTCAAEDSLNLLNTFGSFRLVGFKNSELGPNRIYADIELLYTVRNVGVHNADLISAFRNSGVNGFLDLSLELGARPLIPPGGELGWTEKITFFDLRDVRGRSFENTFLASGEGTTSLTPCMATDIYTLNVA